jgi:putative sigma-54 modulation protein
MHVQIVVSSRHGHLSPASQELARDKVEVVLKHFDRITAIQVTCDFEKRDEVEVELCVKAEHSEEFVATARTESFSSCLDAVVEKMESQLRKHKEKLRDHRTPGHRHQELPPPAGEEE